MPIKSLFVHAMDHHVTEDLVKDLFLKAEIGVVSRVDFMQHGQTGFNERKKNSRYKSAYIHFDSFFDNSTSISIRRNLSSGYKFFINETTYWLLLPNKRPVRKTEMNLHQVVDNARRLEEVVATQAKEIETLKVMLFNVNTQMGIYAQHIAFLEHAVTHLFTPSQTEFEEAI